MSLKSARLFELVVLMIYTADLPSPEMKYRSLTECKKDQTRYHEKIKAIPMY